MATWDVFHSDRLEVGRGLSTAEVRAALASGDLRDDDLIRPAGTTIPWARLADIPPLVDEPAPEPAATLADEPMPSIRDDKDPGEDEDLDEGEDFEEAAPGLEIVGEAQSEPVEERLSAIIDDGEDEDEYDTNLPDREGFSPGSLEVVIWDDGLDAEAGEDFDPQEEDEAAAEFTLSRGSAETVEELDLAAMVDVAFQLVLFFLVTATTILYKSLEVPKPNPENNPAAAAQGKSNKTLDDLKETYILVEIDPSGGVKIDNEPVPAEVSGLAERLRSLRERTGRKAMLLSADFSTPHRSAVLAYDAANEIGLGIAIARPRPPGPAPPPPQAPGGSP